MVLIKASIPWLFDLLWLISWLILSTVEDNVDLTNCIGNDTSFCSILFKTVGANRKQPSHDLLAVRVKLPG